jgi:hypothetical protein
MDDDTLVDDVHPVGEFEGHLTVLLDEQHPEPLVGQPPQRAAQVGGDVRRQTLRDLVDEQQLPAADERAPDRHHLLLPARQAGGVAVEVRLEQREHLQGTPLGGLLFGLRLPRAQRGQPEVLPDGQAGEHPPVLRDVADAELGDALGRQPDEVLALAPDVPAAHGHQPHDRLHGRGLAGAVAPEQRDQLTRLHGEGHTLQHVGQAVVRLDLLDLQQRRGGALGAPARYGGHRLPVR